MSQRNTTPVHSGNYYMVGVQRVLAMLAEMGIVVPDAALMAPPHEGPMKPVTVYTRIEYAMLDWFMGRDFEQAHALIHYRQPRDQWHVIRLLDEEKAPRDMSYDMLCPTKLDALAAVLSACDRDVVRLDACRKDGAAVVVVIDRSDALRIEPVTMEPFDLAVRDRVRAAFKGVRRHDGSEIYSHAARLPGFKTLLATRIGSVERASGGCMLLGFPGNWALAMRNALKQVGVAMKQSQAQELAAVFFGASHWHQLVKQQDEANDVVPPVSVSVEGATGHQCRFYQTPEEAIFAAGKVLEIHHEPVIIKHIGLSTDNHRIVFSAVNQSALQAFTRKDWFLCPSCIEVGYNDYWNVDDYGTEAIADAARQLMASLDGSDGVATTRGVLYDDASDAALLKGLLGREGIPPEQIVYVGDHALAVSYGPEPNGGPRQSAYLQIFRITERGPRMLSNGGVTMYKAEVRVLDDAGGITLMITPDYGKDEPIEIRAENMIQVERLIALTHREDLFSMESVLLLREGQPARRFLQS